MLNVPGCRPYVGVSGITSRAQVEDLIRVAPEIPPLALQRGHPGRRLAVGVLVSDKSLAGQQVRRWRRQPPPESIPEIWDDRVFNTLHYHSELPDAADPLAVARRCGLPPGGGVQLNICWPEPERVWQLRRAGFLPILQVGPAAWRACGGDGELIGRLQSYRSGLSYVLLDLSAGGGVPVDPAQFGVVRRLLSECPWLDLVIAGGLGPGAMSSLDGLMSGHALAYTCQFYLSLDAESGLRTDQDELDVGKCQQYLREAVDLCCGPIVRRAW